MLSQILALSGKFVNNLHQTTVKIKIQKGKAQFQLKKDMIFEISLPIYLFKYNLNDNVRSF